MAIQIGDTRLLPQSAATADFSVDLSGLPVQEGDYVLIGVACNTQSGSLSETSGGGTTWDTTGKMDVTSGPRMWLTWAKVTAGPTISNPTFHISTGTPVWIGFVEIWRDADATTFKNGLATSNLGSVSSAASGSLDPSADNCSIVYFAIGYGGTSDPALRFDSADVVGELIKNIDVSNYMAMAVGTAQQGTHAQTQKTLYANFAQRIGIITLAINNATGGGLNRDARAAMTRVNWFGNFGATHEAVTFAALSGMCSWTGGQIAGIDVDTTIGTVTTSIAVPPVWGADTSLPNTANTASKWGGGWCTIASANMTGKLFSIEWYLPIVALQFGAEGCIIAFGDASGNAAVFRLAKKFSIEASRRYTSFIDVENATPLHTEGSINWAAVTKFGIGYHRAGSSATSRVINFRNAFLHGTTDLVRGSAGAPQSIEYLDKVLNGWGYTGLCERLPNSKAVLVKTDTRFGDGITETYLDATASMVAFPDDYSIDTQPLWQVGANRVGLTLQGSATDTLRQVASTVTGESQQNFTINCVAGADVSLAGTSIIGSLVTLDSDIAVASATISGCGEVAGAGANLTDVSISATSSADAAYSVTANGAVFTRTTFDGTGALYALELADGVTAINMIDCPITAGSTNKVHVLDANALHTVTITISGTTSLVAGDVTSAGAQVAIAAPELYQEVTVTGLAATYRLQIFDIEYVLTVSGITVTPAAGATYTHNGITWTVRSASITAGAGTITVYGTGTPATSGTLTKTGGTGDASVAFSAYAVDGTELYIGVPGATSYTWTDLVAAAAPRVIRVRVMEDGPGTSDAIEMIDAIVGMCGITEGTESVGYLVAAVADDVYNDRGVDGSTITGITIDDTTLRLEIASGTIINYGGTNVLVVDGRDLYAYETYWLGTDDGMRDEARFIEAVDAVNFRCSGFKLLGTSGYPIAIRNCFMVDAATGVFASMVDYSGDPISNHPEHMAAIVVSTSDSVVTGTLSEFIAAVPTAATVAAAVGVEAAANPFAANVKKVNDTTIIGTGVPPTYANMPVPTDPGDPFRVA